MTTDVVRPRGPAGPRVRILEGRRAAVSLTVLTALALALLLASASLAFAGRSATGELAFAPCDRCHPVYVDSNGKPTRPLPSGIERHQIELEVHDILGKDDAACVVCHDDPTRDPGMLKLADGSMVPVTGETSRVCQRCHFEKYREWEVGIHGKHEEKCSAAGCHDPHTPSWIYVAALPPFLGTGLEVKAAGEHEPFVPLAAPPAAPPVYTPTWLTVAAIAGSLIVLGLVGFLVRGRAKR